MLLNVILWLDKKVSEQNVHLKHIPKTYMYKQVSTAQQEPPTNSYSLVPCIGETLYLKTKYEKVKKKTNPTDYLSLRAEIAKNLASNRQQESLK